MKSKLLIFIFAFVAISIYAQIPGAPDASGVINAGPPFVTGSNTGAGELQQQFTYIQSSVDSLETALITDSISTGAMYYSDTYWDDLRVPLTNTRINPVNSEPDFEDRGDGLFAWGFDSDSDSAWVLNFTAQIPHKRSDSTSFDAHLHWQPDGTNTGNVVWKLVYSVANIGGSWTTLDTLRIVDPGNGVALQYQIIEFGTIDGSDTLRISSGIVGNIARMGDAADDTYTGTAFGIEIDFHYQIDSPGSREEYIK